MKNKIKLKGKILQTAFLLFGGFFFCQVGINTATPDSKTLLHVSETDAQGNVQSKGVIIPRLTEAQRDAISPTEAQNSLMIFNMDEDCYNYWSQPDNTPGEWKSVCGGIGNAVFTYDCSDVQVKGNYVKENELGLGNYIEISNINVTRPGAYTITAVSSVDDGFSFTAQGIFSTTGSQSVKLQGQGTPVNDGGPYQFTITPSGSSGDCTVPVTVNTNISAYSINCASLQVNGVYEKGTPLNGSNTITMNVTVSTPGSYNITTDVVNGISFSASGVFSVGTQTITLTGSGSPTVNLDFPITVTSNTVSGNSTCNATIPVVLPAMKYALIGPPGVYGWSDPTRRGPALTNQSSFGINGTVKIAGLTEAWSASDESSAVANLNNSSLPTPDIILYNAYNASISNSGLDNLLVNYVNKGGVLIYASDSAGNGIINGNGLTTAQKIIAGIFGSNYGAKWQDICTANNCPTNTPNADLHYQISNNINSPVINGPFGNLAGQYWAEDNDTNGTIQLPSLPPGSVQVATAYNSYSLWDTDPNASVVWYNDNKNFLMIGDTVGAGAPGGEQNDRTGWPTSYSSTGLPLTKRYTNGAYPQPDIVYNSALELNAIAWALKKAAVAGINPH